MMEHRRIDEDESNLIVAGWLIRKIQPSGVVAYAFGRSRFIAKYTPEWRTAFGPGDELPLMLEQRAKAARHGLFCDQNGERVAAIPLTPLADE